jgi:hypothetical protein
MDIFKDRTGEESRQSLSVPPEEVGETVFLYKGIVSQKEQWRNSANARRELVPHSGPVERQPGRR